MSEPELEKGSQVNLEDAWQTLFKTQSSGGGDEELLRVATDFATQVSAVQMRALTFLYDIALRFEQRNKEGDKFKAQRILEFLERWISFKKNHNSDAFVMRSLDSISLRKFIGENSVKVNIEK